MSEPVKHTMFQFRTMRAPELLSATAKTNYYIEHYNGTAGEFFAAVAAMGPTDVRKVVLEAAATNFTDKKTKEQLIAINQNLYDLGLLLLKNRHKITVAEATAAVSGVIVLTNGQKKTIWDNLFYQTITLESGYIREVTLIMIVANHFVANFGSIPATDLDMQKWANSRVVMPTVLFGVDALFTGATTENELSTGFGALDGQMDAAIAKLTIEQIDKLKGELATYKTAFLKTNNALEKTAIAAHATATKAAQAAATEEDYVDQFTGFTFKRFTDYTPPTYTYVKPAEIDMTPLGAFLSVESNYVMASQRLTTSKTFAELETALDELSTSLTTSIFEKSAFGEQKIAIDGTLISKCGIDDRFKKKYNCVIKLVKRSTNNYGIFMTVEVGSSCLLLDKATTLASVPSGTTHTSKKSSNSNGILTVDLTNGGAADLTGKDGLIISGELIFNNGLKLTHASHLVEIVPGYISFVMTEVVPTNTQPGLDIPSGFGVRRLGIADYRKLEQTLCCYVAGEVSHVENVMAREYKERSTRRLRRQEDTTTISSSSERENQTDTSTTTRFDMQKEISDILSSSQDSSKAFGVNAGSSGTTSVPLVGEVAFTLGADFSSDFSTSSSQEQSNTESTNFAKDVTEKALQRVVSKVSEERITKVIEEFEEKNQHGFDNRQGAEHISGVFRWVDKIYKNEIHNYGKRLQYEFMIPEPAEFHMIAKASGAASAYSTPLIKPLDPRTNSFGSLPPIRNAAHVVPTNYHQWAAAYGATVQPPPKSYLTVGKTLLKPDDGAVWYVPKTVKDEIQIPDGYGIQTILISAGMSDDVDWSHFDASAAGITRRYYDHVIDRIWFADADNSSELRWAHNSIPISAHFFGNQAGMVSYSVLCVRKFVIMEEWQLDTFNAIMSAYEDRLAEYKNEIAELQAKQGILMGDNPAYYRQIENTVLKKSCISYLTGYNYLGQDFTVGNEVTNNQVNVSAEMDKYAVTVKFFEQAFEWNLMDYHFYPFYWGNRKRWEELYSTKNDDALFKAFLSAGMARTIVTVRPGFEEAVMYFMATGLIWNGGEVPVMGDPLYLSILEEIKDAVYTLDETWETRVPSTLTIIQAKTIALDATGLPCFCDDLENPPVETIETPVVNPLTDLDVFIEGNTAP